MSERLSFLPEGCIQGCCWNTLDSPNQWLEHADKCPNKRSSAPTEAPKAQEPQYTNRHGEPCSKACGEGRHTECAENWQTCNCTYRGLHKTPHRYATIPVAAPQAESAHYIQVTGGLCFAHGAYTGQKCPKWPACVTDPQIYKSQAESAGPERGCINHDEIREGCPHCDIEHLARVDSATIAKLRAERDALRMAFDLVATDELFVHPAEGGGWVFWVNVNDMFYPAADGEGIDFSEIPSVWKAWKAHGWPGVVRWVQEKRGGLKLRKSREEKILTLERAEAEVTRLKAALDSIDAEAIAQEIFDESPMIHGRLRCWPGTAHIATKVRMHIAKAREAALSVAAQPPKEQGE